VCLTAERCQALLCDSNATIDKLSSFSSPSSLSPSSERERLEYAQALRWLATGLGADEDMFQSLAVALQARTKTWTGFLCLITENFCLYLAGW